MHFWLLRLWLIPCICVHAMAIQRGNSIIEIYHNVFHYLLFLLSFLLLLLLLWKTLRYNKRTTKTFWSHRRTHSARYNFFILLFYLLWCVFVSVSSGLAARKYKNRCTIKQTRAVQQGVPTQQPELKNVINSAKNRSPGNGSEHRFRRNDNVIVQYWLVSKCALIIFFYIATTK